MNLPLHIDLVGLRRNHGHQYLLTEWRIQLCSIQESSTVHSKTCNHKPINCRDTALQAKRQHSHSFDYSLRDSATINSQYVGLAYTSAPIRLCCQKSTGNCPNCLLQQIQRYRYSAVQHSAPFSVTADFCRNSGIRF